VLTLAYPYPERKLSGALARLLEHPDLGKRLAGEAVKLSPHYRWSGLAKAYAALYDQLLGKKPAAAGKEHP